MLPILTEKRDTIIAEMYQNGIETGAHFSQSTEWAKSYGYVSGECPNAEEICRRLLCVPTHYRLNKKKTDHFAKLISQCFTDECAD